MEFHSHWAFLFYLEKPKFSFQLDFLERNNNIITVLNIQIGQERRSEMADHEIVTQGDITKEAFQEAVDQKRRNGLSFILAVYRTLDEFLEKEKKNSGKVLACEKGCSLCCYQLVSCTEMEIDYPKINPHLL